MAVRAILWQLCLRKCFKIFLKSQNQEMRLCNKGAHFRMKKGFFSNENRGKRGNLLYSLCAMDFTIIILLGCSFYSDNFLKTNTVSSFRCGNNLNFWYAANQCLIYNCNFIRFFLNIIYGQKRQIWLWALKILARIHTDFWFLRFLVLFWAEKNKFWIFYVLTG